MRIFIQTITNMEYYIKPELQVFLYEEEAVLCVSGDVEPYEVTDFEL